MPVNVTIIGSGFAALAAIRTLRRMDAGRSLAVTVIAPQARFVYLPSLIWVPSGTRRGSDLIVPLEDFFARMGVTFHQAECLGLREGGRIVVTTQGEVRNDALLIASGASYLRKAPGIDHTLNPCSGIQPAERFRAWLQRWRGGRIAMGFAGNPDEPSAVRGGPLFEFLFCLHTQLLRENRRESCKLTFFSPMAEPGKRLGPHAVRQLLGAMERRNIATRLGEKIVAFREDRVVTAGGEIKADVTLFIPGMTGSPWFGNCGVPLSPGGFFIADEACRVVGTERVWVAGDAGSFPGPEWRAKQAHMAELQAEAAAINLIHTLHGRPSHVTFRNELICIVDSLDRGTLVSRFSRFNLMLPALKSMHWVKKFLETKTLHRYR
ncbi:MAG: FAD-dependent oxidoreductase [Magnetococcales bacterium]|nr:FAD-dependent oxidoreductase [Magnetococcales bacterium]